MKIELQVDVAELTRKFGLLEKQVAYAAVNAVNRTARRVQLAEHENVRGEFQIRKPAFFFGTPARPGGVAAKIEHFASVKQGRAWAEVAVGRTSKGGPLLLPIFEAGGERKPATPGAEHVAVPLLGRPARPSIAAGVPPAFTFKGLRFRAYQGGKLLRRRRRGRTVDETLFGEFGRLRLDRAEEGGVQWKGLHRTYIVSDVGVFQRIGKERDETRLIYKFLPPFQLEERLRFVAVAERVAKQWFGEELEAGLIDAIAHAARRGAVLQPRLGGLAA